MSLHRVSSMTSHEHVRGSSPARSQHNTLSFNPISWAPAKAKEQPNGAFEVSKTKRITQVAVAVVYCLFSAGVIFGYAALKPVLIHEGVYSQYCSSEEAETLDKTCYEQEIRLNFMFTTAAVATNVCALPVGTVLDRYGPRVSGIVGAVLLTVGTLLLAFAAQLPFDAYIPGYLFLALGGPFVFISSFQLSNTFPRHSGLILALLTGAFDSSSAIFLFYRLIYTASHDTFNLQKFFLVYLIIPVYILLVQIFVMPANSYKTVGELITQAEEESPTESDPSVSNNEDESTRWRTEQDRRQRRESAVDEMTSLLGKGADKQQQEEEKKKEISGVWGALHRLSAWQQIKTPWFILITIFTVLQMTRLNYFIATIYTQYKYMLHSSALASSVNHIFDIALPLGGVLSIPFIGLLLDNTSTPFVLSLLVALASTIGLLGLLPFLWAAYATIALFVLYRPLFYTAISDYAAKVFGFHTFGKVYGLIICLAGLFNFTQSAFDAATHKGFKGDPLPINVVLEVVTLVVGGVLVWFVWWQSKRIHRERVEREAEQTPEQPMPDLGDG